MAGSIPKDFIQQLLDRTDIVSVIEPRLNLISSGAEYKALCPFHEEKTPSFHVIPDRDKQFYYCFGCHAKGDAIGFLMAYDGMDFQEAVEALAGIAGMEVPREHSPQAEARREQKDSLYSVLADSAAYYQQQLREHPGRARAVDYLKSRGIAGVTARDFGLGYAPPGWDNLLRELATTNAARQLLIDSGMLTVRENKDEPYDRFRDRIMFPIRDLRGRVIAFGGRVIDEGEPKYLNSPETELFHKGRELYGLFEARKSVRKLERAVVVEGYTDVIALAQQGVPYAVATLGTAVRSDHIARLFRMVTEVFFCFDGDAAGKRAAWKALSESLPLIRDGLSAHFLFLPEGEDPDSYVRKEGREGFEAALQNAMELADFFFEHQKQEIDTGTLGGRARLAKDAMAYIDRLPDGVYRQLIIDRLAVETGLDPDRLERHVRTSGHGPEDALPPEWHQVESAPFSPGPEPRMRRAAPAPVRSLVERAIALLIRQPDLAASFTREEYAPLATLDGSEPALLLELLQAIEDEDNISPVLLVSRYQDTPHFRFLKALAEQEWLLPNEALQDEFKGTVAGLMKRVDRLSYQSLKQGLLESAFGDMNPAARQRLKDEIARKSGRGEEPASDDI